MENHPNNKNYDFIGREMNNFIVEDVYYKEKPRSYLPKPVRVYYASCLCMTCGTQRIFTVKHLKKILYQGETKDFFCPTCKNYMQSNLSNRITQRDYKKKKENKDDNKS